MLPFDLTPLQPHTNLRKDLGRDALGMVKGESHWRVDSRTINFHHRRPALAESERRHGTE
jgi:hypothetical protein